MKRFFKIILIVFLSLTAVFCILAGVVFLLPPKTEFNPNNLINTNNFITFYDTHNNTVTLSEDKKVSVKSEDLSKDVKNAFVALEDKNFYRHGGIDYKRIAKSAYVNLTSLSFKEGASTISQQLIKNTHLTSKKTLSRKIEEIKLTKELEKRYSKDKILEMYLNTIYFGENCFGIESAAKKYFGKSAKELTLSEGATLAAMIAAPARFNPYKNKEALKNRRNLVLELMAKQNYISNNVASEAKKSDISLNYQAKDFSLAYFNAAVNELNSLTKLSPYELKNCKIITYYDELEQKAVFEARQSNEHDYQAIILDNNSLGISAYYSTCGEIARSPASTSKPFLVYAPAINENLITPYTLINDEPTDFGGYRPANYNDSYYGLIDATTALKRSLNVPAVKIMQSLGIEKSKSYAKKLGIDIFDNSLSIALGSFGSGVYLKDIAAAYSTFANTGKYQKAHFIKEIINSSGKVIYSSKNSGTTVFDSGTATLINEMLQKCTQSGTAKKLGLNGFKCAAKTGTNGTKEGNLDAYSVAYNPNKTFGVWVGNADNSLMPNSITGGGEPTTALAQIYSLCGKKYEKDFEKQGVTDVEIDRLAYEKDGKLLLAAPSSPERYKLKLSFKIGTEPTIYSQAFTLPSACAELSFDGEAVTIKVSSESFVDFKIYKSFDKKEVLIAENCPEYTEKLDKSGIYEYYVVPLIKNKNGDIIGKKIALPLVNFQKPAEELSDNKSSANKKEPLPDEWWNTALNI